MKVQITAFHSLIFTLPILLLVLLASSCGSNKALDHESSIQQTITGWRLVLWKDQENVVLASRDRLVEYNLSAGSVTREICASYKQVDSEFFSPHEGLYFFGDNSHQIIRSLDNPDEIERFYDFWVFREHFPNYGRAAKNYVKKVIDGRTYWSFWTEQLVRTEDGIAHFYKLAGPDDSGIVVLKADGEQKTIDLGLVDSNRIGAHYDRANNRYLWYSTTSNFDTHGGCWPLKGWWVTPEGELGREISLPAGPWVRPYTLWYVLKYFSAGPSTYNDMKLYAAGGKVFAYVSGKAVEKAVGVYQLDERNSVWTRIIKGSIEGDVLFSPNGDLLAYGQNGNATIMRIENGAAHESKNQ